MRTFLLLAVLAAPAAAHPHEWVDWGAGLLLDDAQPSKAVSLVLELTWDEWLSALMLTDFPGIEAKNLTAADLGKLDKAYGLSDPDRAVSLTVTLRGKTLPSPTTLRAVRSDGKQVTLVYEIPLGFSIDAPGELRIELYDPTYYTDMGIRAKSGAFVVGVKNPPVYKGDFALEQDLTHPYYGGSVYPEVVVFKLRP